MPGNILIVSGPSGAGKSTLLNKVLGEYDDLYFSISTTTREIREGEVNGVNYYYIDEEEFKRGIETNEFLEWTKAHGNYYGTSKEPINAALKEGKLIILDVDFVGFELLKKEYPDVVTSVFITTPNLKELKARLDNRQTESEEVKQRRIDNAKKEIHNIKYYDFFIMNDSLDKAHEQMENIINTARCKMSNQRKADFIEQWNK